MPLDDMLGTEEERYYGVSAKPPPPAPSNAQSGVQAGVQSGAQPGVQPAGAVTAPQPTQGARPESPQGGYRYTPPAGAEQALAALETATQPARQPAVAPPRVPQAVRGSGVLQSAQQAPMSGSEPAPGQAAVFGPGQSALLERSGLPSPLAAFEQYQAQRRAPVAPPAPPSVQSGQQVQAVTQQSIANPMEGMSEREAGEYWREEKGLLPGETSEQYIARRQAANMTDMGAAWNMGVKSLQQLGAGAVALGGDVVERATGYDGLREWGMDAYKDIEAEMQPFQAGRISKLEQIENPWDAARFAGFSVGQMAPSLVESMGAGLLGAALGSTVPGAGTAVGAGAGLLGKTAVKGLVSKRVQSMVAKEMAAKGVTKEVAEQSVYKALAPTVGAATAMFTNSYAMGLGDIYGETMDEEGRGNVGASFIGALPYAAMDAFTDLSVFRGILRGTEGEKALARVGKAFLGAGAKEGAAEMGQEAILMLAGASAGKEYQQDEVMSRLANAGAAAFLGGGAFGAAGGLHAPKQTLAERAAAERDAFVTLAYADPDAMRETGVDPVSTFAALRDPRADAGLRLQAVDAVGQTLRSRRLEDLADGWALVGQEAVERKQAMGPVGLQRLIDRGARQTAAAAQRALDQGATPEQAQQISDTLAAQHAARVQEQADVLARIGQATGQDVLGMEADAGQAGGDQAQAGGDLEQAERDQVQGGLDEARAGVAAEGRPTSGVSGALGRDGEGATDPGQFGIDELAPGQAGEQRRRQPMPELDSVQWADQPAERERVPGAGGQWTRELTRSRDGQWVRERALDPQGQVQRERVLSAADVVGEIDAERGSLQGMVRNWSATRPNEPWPKEWQDRLGQLETRRKQWLAPVESQADQVKGKQASAYWRSLRSGKGSKKLLGSPEMAHLRGLREQGQVNNVNDVRSALEQFYAGQSDQAGLGQPSVAAGADGDAGVLADAERAVGASAGTGAGAGATADESTATALDAATAGALGTGQQAGLADAQSQQGAETGAAAPTGDAGATAGAVGAAADDAGAESAAAAQRFVRARYNDESIGRVIADDDGGGFPIVQDAKTGKIAPLNPIVMVDIESAEDALTEFGGKAKPRLTEKGGLFKNNIVELASEPGVPWRTTGKSEGTPSKPGPKEIENEAGEKRMVRARALRVYTGQIPQQWIDEIKFGGNQQGQGGRTQRDGGSNVTGDAQGAVSENQAGGDAGQPGAAAAGVPAPVGEQDPAVVPGAQAPGADVAVSESGADAQAGLGQAEVGGAGAAQADQAPDSPAMTRARGLRAEYEQLIQEQASPRRKQGKLGAFKRKLRQAAKQTPANDERATMLLDLIGTRAGLEQGLEFGAAQAETITTGAQADAEEMQGQGQGAQAADAIGQGAAIPEPTVRPGERGARVGDIVEDAGSRTRWELREVSPPVSQGSGVKPGSVVRKLVARKNKEGQWEAVTTRGKGQRISLGEWGRFTGGGVDLELQAEEVAQAADADAPLTLEAAEQRLSVLENQQEAVQQEFLDQGQVPVEDARLNQRIQEARAQVEQLRAAEAGGQQSQQLTANAAQSGPPAIPDGVSVTKVERVPDNEPRSQGRAGQWRAYVRRENPRLPVVGYGRNDHEAVRDALSQLGVSGQQQGQPAADFKQVIEQSAPAGWYGDWPKTAQIVNALVDAGLDKEQVPRRGQQSEREYTEQVGGFIRSLLSRPQGQQVNQQRTPELVTPEDDDMAQHGKDINTMARWVNALSDEDYAHLQQAFGQSEPQAPLRFPSGYRMAAPRDFAKVKEQWQQSLDARGAQAPTDETQGEQQAQTDRDAERRAAIQKAQQDELDALFGPKDQAQQPAAQDQADADEDGYSPEQDIAKTKKALQRAKREGKAEKVTELERKLRSQRQNVFEAEGELEAKGYLEDFASLFPGAPKKPQEVATATPQAQVTPRPRTAGEAATSAAQNAAQGLSEVAQGLNALFGSKPGQLNSGLAFDEKTYEQAKPLFISGVRHLGQAGQDIVDVVRALVRVLVKDHGLTRAAVENMEPYITRFAEDVESGAVALDAEPAQDAAATLNAEGQQEGQVDVNAGVRGDGAQALEGVAAGEVEGAEGGGTGGGGGDGRGAGGAEGVSGTDNAGVSGPRGGGSGQGEVSDPAAGAGQTGRGRGRRGSGKGAAVSEGDGRVSGSELDGQGLKEGDAGTGRINGVLVAPPAIPKKNFVISDELGLGEGGQVRKYNDNVAAIKLLQTLKAERRQATPDEQAVLARYVGWGGIPQAFPSPQTGGFTKGWEQRGEALRDLLGGETDPRYRTARQSTQYAHYTSQAVVQGMWSLAERLGFRGGLMLESSAGIGNFLGLMPERLSGATKAIAVEMDGITAGVLGQLYPQASAIHSPTNKLPIPANSFDLAIGNPPYSSNGLRWQFKPFVNRFSMHNQFVLADLDALKEDGLYVGVVTHSLLDAADPAARQEMARRASFVGAIRLPDTAFKGNALTEVVTDILVFRKRTAAEQARYDMGADLEGRDTSRTTAADALEAIQYYERERDWTTTEKVADPLGGDPIKVSSFFARFPNLMLGTLERSGTMRHKNDVTLRAHEGVDLAEALRDAINQFPAQLTNPSQAVIDRSVERFKSMAEALEIAASGAEPGSMRFNEAGQLEQVIERENSNGDLELTRRVLSARSPWSPQLLLDADKRWYRVEAKVDEKGNKVKERVGRAQRNVYERFVYERDEDIPDALRLGKLNFDRLKQLIELRDLLKKQLVLETRGAEDAVLEDNRGKLRAAYEAYTKQHGLINEDKTARLLSEMPDGALVLALELGFKKGVGKAAAAKVGEKPRAASAKPADIMRTRVIFPYEPAERADSVNDALVISLSERGRVDPERIAKLLGVTREEAERQLTSGDAPVAFRDPETGRLEPRDNYLSGDVVRKLQAAQGAGLEANVKALEAVQPEPWTSDKVTVHIGAPWVPTDVYEGFVSHITGGRARVAFSPLTNTYTIGVNGANQDKTNNEWGVEKADAIQLLDALFNSRSVRIGWTDQDGKFHLDDALTAAAAAKSKEIASEFMDWVFKDSDQRERLTALFNAKYNTRLNRQWDGSHLELPGKSPLITMRRHQSNAIWRGIVEDTLLIDHTVGAGKTFTAIARAMERRRMGLSRKPMIVVPNHLVESWAADVYRLYPGAKVLAAGKKDFSRQRRRRLFAKIATGDWDIVIVPHSSFGKVGISPEAEERYLQEALDEAIAARDEAADAAEADGYQGRGKPLGVKAAEALMEKIQKKLDSLRAGGRDNLLSFEELGVDDITVDESHMFKNLYYTSNLQGVRGMGNRTGSQKAFDLYNKIRVTKEQDGGVTFLTGTPISNSAVEMYTLMRYLVPDELEALGMSHFDAWRAQYVESQTSWEMNDTARLQEVTRLGPGWSNMRSLMELYYSFTDAVTLDDIKKAYAEDNPGKKFPVPDVKGGGRQTVKVAPTERQAEILDQVIQGFDGLSQIEDMQERNAERLRLMDRARKISLDPRAVDPTIVSDEKGGKLDVASQEIARLYRAFNEDRGTQLVFLDRSIPRSNADAKLIREYDAIKREEREAILRGDDAAVARAQDRLEKFEGVPIEEMRAAQRGGWNAYQQLKDNLVAQGIPENQIRFIQEANTDDQKKALFDAVNLGAVRVLIGSTDRMGAGTNVQERLVGLHHLDINWRPSDVEQREGRIVRQGNSLLEKYGDGFEVEVLAYVTERTVDAKMWELNAKKLQNINGVRNYDGSFEMDFNDEQAASMAETAAIASGDPLLLERVKLTGEIEKLELLQRAYQRRRWSMESEEKELSNKLERLPTLIEREERNQGEAKALVDDVRRQASKRKIKIEDREFTLETAFSAQNYANQLIDAQKGGDSKAKFTLTVDGEVYRSREKVLETIGKTLGDDDPMVAEFEGVAYTRQGELAKAITPEVNKRLDQDTDEPVSVGTFMGLPLSFDVSKSGSFAGETTYRFELYLGEIGQSTRRFDGAMSSSLLARALDDVYLDLVQTARGSRVDGYRRSLSDARNRLPEVKKALEKPFDQAGELVAARERLAEVIGALSAADSQAQQQGDVAQQAGEQAQAEAEQETAPPLTPAERRRGRKSAFAEHERVWPDAQSHLTGGNYRWLMQVQPENGTGSVDVVYDLGRTLKLDQAHQAVLERLLRDITAELELDGVPLTMLVQTGRELNAEGKAANRVVQINQQLIRDYGKAPLTNGGADIWSLARLLAHELTHIQQEETGAFSKDEKGNTLFRGEVANFSLPWAARAWEQEASSAEEVVAKKIMAALVTDGTIAERPSASDGGPRFAVMTEEKEGGGYVPARLSAGGRQPATGTTQAAVDAVKASLGERAPSINVVQSIEQLPPSLLAEARKQAGPVRAVYWRGQVHVVDRGQGRLQTERDLKHELLHAALAQGWDRGAFRSMGAGEVHQGLVSLYRALGGAEGVQRMAERYGVDLGPYRAASAQMGDQAAQALLTEELLAALNEGGPVTIGAEVRRALAKVAAAIRAWLRSAGLDEIADWVGGSDARAFEVLSESARFWSGKGPRVVTARTRGGLARFSMDGGAANPDGLPATITVDGKQRPTTNSNRQPIHTTEEGVRNFWKWFSGSRVVDGDGRPLVVYHGTKASITEFDPARTRSDRYTKEYGVFLTPKRRYAEMYSEGKEPMALYARIENPKTAAWKGDISTRDLTKQDSEKLASDGYDGVIINDRNQSARDADEIVAFEPNQIKSATGNTGTFDGASPDIRFALGTPRQAIQGIKGKVQAAREDIKATLAATGGVGKTTERTLGKGLGALTVRMLTEVASERLPSARQFEAGMQQYQTERNKMADAASQRADEITRHPHDETLALMHLMNDSTIDGIDASLDDLELLEPDVEAAQQRMAEIRKRIRTLREQVRTQRHMKDSALTRSADQGIKEEAEALKQLQGRLKRDARRKKQHQGLHARFLALPQWARTMYEDVRDDYKRMSERMEQALYDRVVKSQLAAEEQVMKRLTDARSLDHETRLVLLQMLSEGMYNMEREPNGRMGLEVRKDIKRALDGSGLSKRDQVEIRKRLAEGLQTKKAMIERVRLEFQAGRVEGVYFPLQRHGSYYAVLKRDRRDADTGEVDRAPDGSPMQETAFVMFDSELQMNKEKQEWEADGWTVTSKGYKGQEVAQQDEVSEAFVAQVVEKLAGQGDDKQADQVFQMYLDVLPYLSARKHFVHRKKTPGYAADLARTYAFNMSHLANQIARMEAQPMLSSAVAGMKHGIKVRTQERPGGDTTREEQFLDEYKKRYEWIMSPGGAPWASRLTGLGFLWFLGASPAAALVNLTQTPLVALPQLAGEFGFRKSGAALTKAMTETIAARRKWGARADYSAWRGLSEEDRQMLAWAHETGAIDATNVHSLMEISEGGDKQFGRAWSKTMEAVGFMFHEAEIVNREATLLAGYRLARAKGLAPAAARQSSADNMWASHGDYSNANRARWLQPNAAKVLFLFKQYSQLMAWFMARNAWQMVKGATPEERKAASKRIGGLLGMTMVFSGSMGLPTAVTWPLFVIAEAAHTLFGDDDDEPWDAETAWRNLLAEAGFAGKVIDRGVVNAVTGADVAGRVGLDQLFFRDPWADEQGGREAYQHWLSQLLGPMGSIAQNAFVAGDDLENGDVWRAAERLTPTAVRNVLQAVRWADEGVLNSQGEAIVERGDLSPWELFLKFNGMTPDEVSAQYDMNRMVKNYEQRLVKDRARLLTAYWFAYLDGTPADRRKVMEKIGRYNAGRPAKPIDVETLRRSVKTRMRYRGEAISGVNLDTDYRYLVDRAQVAM